MIKRRITKMEIEPLKSWLFKDHIVKSVKEIGDILGIENHRELFGFIYLLEFDNDKKYIGKKNFYFFKQSPTLKSGLPREGHIKFFNRLVNHHRKEHELFRVESDWLEYQGSSNWTKQHQVVKKEILEVTKSKRYLTYLEVKYLFQYNAIIDEDFVNENILRLFFRGNIMSQEEDWDQVIADTKGLA